MQSTEFIDELQELPGDAYVEHQSFGGILTDLASMDPTFYGAETASGSSLAMWSIFDGVNVDDMLQEAYKRAYPKLAEEHSLYEHLMELEASGEGSIAGFLNGIKGKLAEFHSKELLEQRGYQNVEIAENPIQPIWDISAVSETGDQVLLQVKTGAGSYTSKVVSAIEANPDVEFLVSSEIYQRILRSDPHLADHVTNIGADYRRVEGIEDGLTTLSDNMGIDVPDGVTDLLPYVGAITAGVRLIYSVVSTERNFRDTDRTTRNKIQVVQTLTLMSRMGVSVVLAISGGQAGAAAGGLLGSVVPGVGNAAGGIGGGIGGSIAGAGMGILLNRRLQPQMLNLALDITGLTNDDLFYYKNKQRIDEIGDSIQGSAFAIATLAAL